MRWSGLTGSVAVFVVVATCGWVVGPAAALPLAGKVLNAETETPFVQRTAHEHKQWRWSGHWWRHGPWADHTIYGAVMIPPVPNNTFVPWRSDRLERCAARYHSFDPSTGTYLTRSGQRRVCR